MNNFKCRLCGKTIDFIKTKGGKIIPFDVDFQGFFLDGNEYRKVYKLHECAEQAEKRTAKLNNHDQI